MGGLVELLVMINTEATDRRGSRACSAELRGEVARRHARENDQRREAMEIWNTHPSSNGRNLRIVPLNWESEWRAPEYAEVVGVMGIFPDVLAREHQISSCSLLQANMEFVAPPRAEGSHCI